MSKLYLVRHGQASFGAADYDALSAIGPEQLARLGEHWLHCEVRPDAIVTGTLVRQCQSEQAWRAKFAAADVHLPPAERSAAFDEYDHKPLLREQARWIRENSDTELDRERLNTDRRYFNTFMNGALERWLAGELQAEGLKAWADFQHDALQAVDDICARTGSGQSVAVFTSAGVIGAIVAGILGVDAKRTIDLKLALHNGSVTTLLFNQERISLSSFNSTDHLQSQADKRLLTYR